MSADQPTDAPKFYRLAFPDLSMWVAGYEEKSGWMGGFQVVLTAHKPGAKLFVYPKMVMIEKLRAGFGRLEIEPASFEEWVEQEEKE